MKTFINLIPIEYRWRRLIRRRLRQWSLIWALCLIALVAIGHRKVNRYQFDCKTADLAAERYRPLDALIGETESMRRASQDLKAKGTLVAQLKDERPVSALLELASRSAARCEGQLHLTELEYEHERQTLGSIGGPSRAGAKHNGDAPGVEPARVRFAGQALDNLAIAAFAAALRDSRMFRSVELKSSVEETNRPAPRRSFDLTGEI